VKIVYLQQNNMKIIHISYNIPRPQYTDPWAWLKFLSFLTSILESAALHSEVIAIFNINYDGIVQHNGVTYHFAKPSRWHLNLPFKLNRYVKKLHPDVVVVHGLIFPWQVVVLRWQLGRRLKIIAQHHAEPPFTDLRKYFQQLADKFIHAYLFASCELGMEWVKKGQIHNPKKIKQIMGTSSSFYPMEKDKARSITKVRGETVFLWVGRLDANKDPLLVANAFAKFIRSKPEANLYFIYQTFELLEELKVTIAETPGASDRIHLVGKVNNTDLQFWYNSAEFIISSSHYEGSGVAVCEAMSCGCIPVLTNIPSFRTMTDNGRIGLLYEAGSAEELFIALENSLTFNVEMEKRKVLEQFNNHFSAEANARKFMDVINEIEHQA
jgi:glycosyltransferase involved in cell wall biosynthesis